MHGPEAAQNLMRRLRQRNETIPVALGVANVHTSAYCIDIADLQPQSFSQAQSQAIKREEEYPVADHARGQLPGILLHAL